MNKKAIETMKRRKLREGISADVANAMNVMGTIALAAGGVKAEEFRIFGAVAITEQTLPRVATILGRAWRDLAVAIAGGAS